MLLICLVPDERRHLSIVALKRHKLVLAILFDAVLYQPINIEEPLRLIWSINRLKYTLFPQAFDYDFLGTTLLLNENWIVLIELAFIGQDRAIFSVVDATLLLITLIAAITRLGHNVWLKLNMLLEDL